MALVDGASALVSKMIVLLLCYSVLQDFILFKGTREQATSRN